MPFKINPIYGTLDLVGTSSSSGGVTGIAPTTITGIAQWADTTGTTIKDSPYTLIQNGGAIQAQGFVFDRQILNDITVPNKFTIVNTDAELISGDIILLGDAQLLLL
jgi:hypothetical protein